jgi:biotin-dependent carboxylase-like uncharacterized protein
MAPKTGLLLKKVNIFTQIQDLGRFGGARLGLTQGGVVDMTSARIANALVGNHQDASLLELGLGSLQFQAMGNICIALTGAMMPLSINGKPCSRYQSLHMLDGDTLDVGYSSAGTRCYLAVTGGFAVEPVLGSCSTVLRERMGGVDGQPLREGQILAIPKEGTDFRSRSLPYHWQLKPKMMQQIPFVIGAQQPELGHNLLNRFVSGVYQILSMSDRMGVRFRGTPLSLSSQSLISEGVCLGAIQLPADGQPIVMLNDHQTIGGYPKIGAVTRLGVNALGQCRPGCLVRFHLITLEEATARARRHEQWLRTLEQLLVEQNQ